jgi:hypothetical protein
MKRVSRLVAVALVVAAITLALAIPAFAAKPGGSNYFARTARKTLPPHFSLDQP